MSRAQRIRNILTRELQPASLTVIDESDRHEGHAGARPEGETHYRVCLSSPLLNGLSRVEQHRRVYSLLSEEFFSGLHALALEISPTEDNNLN